MSGPWIRGRPGPREHVGAAVVAAAVAVGVGAVTFWLARTLLSREPLAGGGPARRLAAAPEGSAPERGKLR